jgi:hypothetical protein
VGVRLRACIVMAKCLFRGRSGTRYLAEELGIALVMDVGDDEPPAVLGHVEPSRMHVQ